MITLILNQYMCVEKLEQASLLVSAYVVYLLQFFKGYDKLLTTYMRHGEGIGVDLTVVRPATCSDTALSPSDLGLCCNL